MAMLSPDSPNSPSRKRVVVGRLCVVGAALLWSSSGLFAKAPLFADWPEAQRGLLLAFWRAGFAAMVLLPAVRGVRWRAGLVPLGVCFVVMNVTFLSAMSLSTAANTTWLQATAPWWVFVLSTLVVREPVARRDLVPLAFGAAGVGLILGFELTSGQAGSTAGVLCGLVAGVSYAGVIVCLRRLRGENPFWLVAACHLASATALAPCVVWLGVWPSAWQLLVLVGFGVIQMALPYLLMLHGLRAITSQEAAGIGLVEPVVLPLWVFLVWGETPAWWTVAGAGLILVGLVLRYVVLAARQPRVLHG
ncbi:MAG: EamA family transporter [Pirellulales bacterium]|nr:EamA family transporter [Pirellulales bacterium]